MAGTNLPCALNDTTALSDRSCCFAWCRYYVFKMSGPHRDGMRGSVCALNGAVWLIPNHRRARRHRGSVMQSDATQISARVSNEWGRGEQKQPCQRGSAVSGLKIIKQTHTHTHTHTQTDICCMNLCRSFNHKCKNKQAFLSIKSSSDWIFLAGIIIFLSLTPVKYTLVMSYPAVLFT